MSHLTRGTTRASRFRRRGIGISGVAAAIMLMLGFATPAQAAVTVTSVTSTAVCSYSNGRLELSGTVVGMGSGRAVKTVTAIPSNGTASAQDRVTFERANNFTDTFTIPATIDTGNFDGFVTIKVGGTINTVAVGCGAGKFDVTLSANCTGPVTGKVTAAPTDNVAGLPGRVYIQGSNKSLPFTTDSDGSYRVTPTTAEVSRTSRWDVRIGVNEQVLASGQVEASC